MSKLEKLPSGPAVEVHIFSSQGNITEVNLFESNGEFKFQLVGDQSLKNDIQTWLTAYGQKKQTKMALPLDRSLISGFTAQVLEALQAIPFGKTLTYSQIASSIGKPKAYRAVGSGCGRNPYPLFIPCHRVLSTQGLGGYSEGIEIKKKLLAFES